MNIEKLLTVEQVAKLLNLCTKTIYKHREGLPYIGCGRKIYFDKNELMKHISNNPDITGKENKVFYDSIANEISIKEEYEIKWHCHFLGYL